MGEETRFAISLEHAQDGKVTVRFDWDEVPGVVLDELAWLDEQRTPHATLILATALGNCLGVSLLSCLHKLQVEPQGIQTTVSGAIACSERGRAQISHLDVQISLGGADHLASRLKRCLELDDEYCLITESVRAGIPINIHVLGTDRQQVPNCDSVVDSEIRQMYN
jgi:uncharacterized OsmC-like protein